MWGSNRVAGEGTVSQGVGGTYKEEGVNYQGTETYNQRFLH
jgi:hypothetical protein